MFHRRFKAVTALSPLQYQKHIRLQEARRRMVSKEADAASVSFAVGYKSTSQFSREYKRLFGEPRVVMPTWCRRWSKLACNNRRSGWCRRHVL